MCILRIKNVKEGNVKIIPDFLTIDADVTD